MSEVQKHQSEIADLRHLIHDMDYNVPRNQLPGNVKFAHTVLDSLCGKMDIDTFFIALYLLRDIGLPIPMLDIIANAYRFDSLSERDARDILSILYKTASSATYKDLIDRLVVRFPGLMSGV